jgi:hypothetical protein
VDIIQSIREKYFDNGTRNRLNGLGPGPEDYYWVHDFQDETSFHRSLYLERKRLGRTSRPFLFMEVDIEQSSSDYGSDRKVINEIVSTLCLATRDVDIKGWHTYPSVIGILYYIVDRIDDDVRSKILHRLRTNLSQALPPAQFRQIGMSFRSVSEELITISDRKHHGAATASLEQPTRSSCRLSQSAGLMISGPVQMPAVIPNNSQSGGISENEEQIRRGRRQVSP